VSAEEDRGGEGEDRPGAYGLRAAQGTMKYAEELTRENQRLRAQVAALLSEKAGLVTGLQRAREEGDLHAARCRELEVHNASLARLFAMTYRLHGTLDGPELLATIRDIVTKLVRPPDPHDPRCGSAEIE
jgi:hypothetical protein